MTLASSWRTRAALVAAGLLAASTVTQAQAPAADPAGIWTLQDENASLSTAALTDRYYVNGLRLGYTSPEGAEPGFLARVASVFGPGGAVRFSFDLSQQIYTPDDTRASQPPPGDRPYAGVLLGTLGVLRDTPDSRSLFALSLGVVGPDALAEQLQNGFHDVIGQGHTEGWKDQLRNEPLGEFTSARTWRLGMASFAGLETDALPDLAIGLGNERIYAQSGVVVRLGQGLGSDFGAARVAPGMSGGDAYTPTRPFVWYVFGGADGQVVGHDITLNGTEFQSSANVAPRPLVGEFEAGLGMIAFGARLTFTQVFQTQEFAHQKGGLHQFGSLALSMRF